MFYMFRSKHYLSITFFVFYDIIFLIYQVIPMKIYSYPLTSQLYNSDSILAKTATYSIVGIALVALVETIKNIVLCPFNFVSELYSSKTEDKKIEVKKEQPKRNWKKIVISGSFLVAATILGISLLKSWNNTAEFKPLKEYPNNTPEDKPLNFREKKGKETCEIFFANGFKGSAELYHVRPLGEVTIPALNPDEYILHDSKSYPLRNNKTDTYCDASLTDKGNKRISQIIPEKIRRSASLITYRTKDISVKLWRMVTV